MNIALIKAIVILPGTALIYVPALIILLTQNTPYAASFPPSATITWMTGLAFSVTGLTLMYWKMKIFNNKGGGGTPAPWDPINNLIVEGPYRYVRNPMLVGVNLFLMAEAILMQSLPVFGWMIVFLVLNTAYFALSEEPQLENRFGKACVKYKRSVPRWIPRISRYNGDRED